MSSTLLCVVAALLLTAPIVIGCSGVRADRERQTSLTPTVTEPFLVSVEPADRLSAAQADTRTFDFGKVIEGEDLRHLFVVQNTASAPLTILGVKKSCGCEATNIVEGTIIKAGESLEVSYALSKHGSGQRKGQLILTTDAEDESLRRIELHLHAEIQPKVWTTPAEIELNADDPSSAEQILKVESIVPGFLASFREATTNRGNVQIELIEQSAEALSFRVGLMLDAPWGTFYDLIYLSFDNKEHRSVNVRVKARKGHPLAIIPATIKLTPSSSSSQRTRKVRILSPGAKSEPFRIAKVECPAGVVVGELPTEPRNICDVTLSFDELPSVLPERAVVFHTEPAGAVTLIVHDVISPNSSKDKP
jgi:hypothetical protein